MLSALLAYTERFAVEPLVEAALKLLLARPESGLAEAPRKVLASASEGAWQRALESLAPHKVISLLGHQLEQFGLLAHVPEAARTRIVETHREVRAANTMQLLSAGTILRQAAQRGETLLLVKGLLFADSYYPDFSTRPMGDIDLVALPGRAEAMFEALRAAGYAPAQDRVPQDDALVFEDRHGLTCDAHRTLGMFGHEPVEQYTVEISLQKLRGVRVRALEPSSMLAHLVVHLEGHLEDLGPVLLWLLDFVFVLRREGAAIDLARVRSLLQSEARYVFLLRTLGMLHAAGEPLPPALRGPVLEVSPLSLGLVLRQRRMVPWGLPAPRGWLRLALHQLAVRRAQGRPLPHWQDLVLWPLDGLSARAAASRARKDG